MPPLPSRTVISAALAVTIPIVATSCAPTNPGPPANRPVMQHVHELAFTHFNARLLIASHDGVYGADLPGDQASLFGGEPFDAMGMAVQGDTVWVSGHPAPTSSDMFTAPNIGLVQHSAAGWQPVSLAGVTDFHALAATPADPNLVVGLPSDRPVLMRSTDAGRTWAETAALNARDISIDIQDPTLIVATTPDGVLFSNDAGSTFTPLPGAPTLNVIGPDPTRPAGLIGIDLDGGLWMGSARPDATWTSPVTVSTTAVAIAMGSDGAIAIADDTGVSITRDQGATWTPVMLTAS